MCLTISVSPLNMCAMSSGPMVFMCLLFSYRSFCFQAHGFAIGKDTLQRVPVIAPSTLTNGMRYSSVRRGGKELSASSRDVQAKFSSQDSSRSSANKDDQVPLYRSEGIFSVIKPAEWTSNDVVSYIRGMLERDARERGARPVSIRSRRNKNRIVRIGHGGTLDPLATGVLVIGVGKGTKLLKRYVH